jgi:glutathione S-transferase
MCFSIAHDSLRAGPPEPSLNEDFMLTLLQHAFCPHSRFIRLALAEHGLECRLVEERVWERREAFLELNPAATTPVLVEEGHPPVPGAMVIAEYLDETRGAGLREQRLMPEDPIARVEVRRLTGWFNDKFFAALLHAHVTLVAALHDHGPADLGEELVVEPAGEAAHLDAGNRVLGHQPPLLQPGPARLVEVFGDYRGARHRRVAFFDQHRGGGGGIELKKRLTALPNPLFDQAAFESMLGQRQPDKARVRAECVLQQRQHEVFVDGAPGRSGKAGIMRNPKAHSGGSLQRVAAEKRRRYAGSELLS